MSRAKHPDQRHGHRTRAENAYDVVPGGGDLEWPDPAADWHEIATGWYLSLRESGQAAEYAQSDVALAVLLADQLSRMLARPGPFGGNALSAWLSGAGDLLCTVGARRKARMELAPRDETQGAAQRAAVAWLADRHGGPA